MQTSIRFRDFEERDIDFIYKCKNDKKLNKYIVGQYKPFSYDDARTWVHGCMTDNTSFKFWAICTNDQSSTIIGWISLSNINTEDKSACFHGIVIGDKNYRDGKAWIESYLLLFEYFFQTLKFNRLYGSHLSVHPSSGIIAESMFMDVDGKIEDAKIFDGKSVDIIQVSILADNYFFHLSKGDYEYNKIVGRILRKRKELKYKKNH